MILRIVDGNFTDEYLTTEFGASEMRPSVLKGWSAFRNDGIHFLC